MPRRLLRNRWKRQHSFLARQLKTHLNIEVPDLAQSHLKDLAEWGENSGALIMDAAKAAEIAKKIAAL